jgi:secretion/DNA translocation related CpaE-like protein
MARTERATAGAGVVGVVGARGGAGATVTAAVLAAELARRGTAVLVETGPGPSVDTLLGLEAHPGLRWPDLTGAIGSVDAALLAGNLMRWRGCSVLPTDDARPGPPPAAVVPDVLTALTAAHTSVVLDLDRADVLAAARAGAGPDAGDDTEDASATTLVAACRTVLVVVPRDVLAVAGARLLRDALVTPGRRVGLVTRGPAPGGLGPADVARATDLPVVASLPRARELGGALDRGVGPVLPPAAARVVARLAERLT